MVLLYTHGERLNIKPAETWPDTTKNTKSHRGTNYFFRQRQSIRQSASFFITQLQPFKKTAAHLNMTGFALDDDIVDDFKPDELVFINSG